MGHAPDILLQLDGVDRVYPRDVSRMPSSVLREMFLPLKKLEHCPPTHFHALRGIDLALSRGQRAGVLGAHRSGKSTLAAIAAGLMRPTKGTVTAGASRSLMTRPTAGFKPALSVIENLSFRAMLHGLTGGPLQEAIERTLQACNVGGDDARRAIGNLSPHVVKQLGMVLLLEIPAEVLVIDELSGAGPGAARWETRARLQDKVESGTALVISRDTNLLADLVEQAWVLHQARLYGPFAVEQAIEAFGQLPPEGVVDAHLPESYDPMVPPRVRSNAGLSMNSAGYDYDELEGADGDPSEDDGLTAAPAKVPSCPWIASAIGVDGQDLRSSRMSLIRAPGSVMQVSIELASLADQDFTGGLFSLHGGNSGLELGRFHYPHDALTVAAGDRMALRFEFVAPDWGEDFYGLSFCPQSRGKHYAQEHRIKILIFGVGRKHESRQERVLEIRNSSFERKLDNASVDTLPRPAEGQQATGQMGGKVWAAP